MTSVVFTTFIFKGGRFRRGGELVQIEKIMSTQRLSPLEGFIQMRVGERDVFHRDLWDTLDFLWPMYLQIAVDLLEGRTAEVHLPDKNRVAIAVRPVGTGPMVTLSVEPPASEADLAVVVTMRREDLLEAILRDSDIFFKKMKQVAHPRDIPGYEAHAMWRREIEEKLQATRSKPSRRNAR